jgi:phosphatidylglycerol:prolipoprotein diacylglycerol transferase
VSDPFVHHIDPILVSIGGIHLWWYGLSYGIGFLNLHWHLRRARQRLGMSLSEVYSLSLWIALGVLVGGRAIEVLFDEWPFYREHPLMIPAYWLGGMATHGLLLGAGAGVTLFTSVYRRSFLKLADELVIPGAFLMGVGRIGNFIDGLIVGHVTEVWWGVQFPDAAGIRHPVVLYDGAKNLLLVPYLLWVRNTNPTPGATAARFVFWYAFPRIFIDLFRDYPTHRLALGTGQTLNIFMALLGLVLLARSRLRRLGRLAGHATRPTRSSPIADIPPRRWQSFAFACVLVFCLTIPSNWTQDVPARYGKRHPELKHSWIYPQVDTAPRPDRIGASASSRPRRRWPAQPLRLRADPRQSRRSGRPSAGNTEGRLLSRQL